FDPSQRFARADYDRVAGGPGAEDIEGLRRRDPEATALARREPPKAIVATELRSVLVDDRSVLRLQTVAAEERAVVVAGEEARLLALGTASRRQTRALGLGAGRLFVLLAEREGDAREVPRI